MVGGTCGGACMAGGHGWQGTCMAGGRGHAWQGVCMAEDMHGRGHAWREMCMAGDMHGRGHAWQILRDTINERAVRILQECILVSIVSREVAHTVVNSFGE